MKILYNKIYCLILFCAIYVVAYAVDTPATLYGRVAVQGVYNNTHTDKGFGVQNGFSYFGLAGKLDVSKNNSFIWQIENLVNFTVGNPYSKVTGLGGFVTTNPKVSKTFNPDGRAMLAFNTLASSDTFLGFLSDWGKLRVGHISNTFRSNTGAIDIFLGNGSSGYQNYDNVFAIIPGMIRYDSPNWGGFNFAAYYSPNNIDSFYDSSIVTTGFEISPSQANGSYGYGLYGGGLYYQIAHVLFTYNTQFMNGVGTYRNKGPGLTPYKDFTPSPFVAWIHRLEVGWQEPNGIVLGAGAQITNGYLYNAWAGNVGSSEYIASPQFAQFAQYNQGQTAEFGASLGWHLGNWTPKFSYVSGTNIMMNQNNVLLNTLQLKNQVGDTWYQQALAEIDWSISPKTILFTGLGNIWWGSTARAIDWQFNQATVSAGFSYVF